MYDCIFVTVITPHVDENITTSVNPNSTDQINIDQLNLPKRTTDWDTKLRDIMSKKA